MQWTPEPGFAAWLAPRLIGMDVVHAHMFGAWWAAALAAPADAPLVASEHNQYLWPDRPYPAEMVEALDRVGVFFAHGPGARDTVLAHGLPLERVREGVSPVVGTDVDGLPATLGDGRGVLVSPEDPQALAAALEVALNDELPRPQPLRNFTDHYEPARVADVYERTYRDLLAPGPALAEHLAPDAIVVLDDIDRRGELQVLAAWERECGFRFEIRPAERIAVGRRS